MSSVIRLGDPTTHGGKVVECASKNVKAGSLPMAVVGDRVSCPLPGHTNCTITSGHAKHRINGKPVAYEGDTVSCGATLLSTKPNFKSD